MWIAVSPALGLVVMISGCGLVVPSLSKQSEVLVSAEPLAITANELESAANSSNKREFLGRVVYDSEQKCVSFLNRLVLARNTVDTTGDIMAAALSGVGALVTPLSTAHALSGAATFVTGSKAAIDNDIYAKASLSSFQIALQQSYFNKIADYTVALPKLSEGSLILSNEMVKIESIHALCALAPAEASIQATITPPRGGTPPPPTSPPLAAPARPLLQDEGATTRGAVPGAPLF